MGKNIRGFCDECLARLKHYHYPNNVQELLTVVASVVAREESDIITVESLPYHISRGSQARNCRKKIEPRKT